MELNVYNTRLEDDYKISLVKERSLAYNGGNVTEPRKAVRLMTELFCMDRLAEEYVYAISFTAKQRPLGVFEVTHGTINVSLCNPREVMVRNLLCGASCFMLFHNHPSGEPGPSQDDMMLTRKMSEAGRLMGLPLLDHIIIGRNGYYSFHEAGLS